MRVHFDEHNDDVGDGDKYGGEDNKDDSEGDKADNDDDDSNGQVFSPTLIQLRFFFFFISPLPPPPPQKKKKKKKERKEESKILPDQNAFRNLQKKKTYVR